MAQIDYRHFAPCINGINANRAHESCTTSIRVFLVPFRAEELETALMEMVKQDNRRELSARVN